MLSLNPPEASDRDWVDIHDSRLKETANRYHCLSRDIEVLEEELKRLKKELTDGAGHVRARIGCLNVSKISVEGRIDYKKAVNDLGLSDEDCEKYRGKSTQYWRINANEGSDD